MEKQDVVYLRECLSFWDNLTKAQQEKIIKNTKAIKYKKNENVYNYLKECLGIIIIKKGELRAYLLSEEGKEATLFRIFEKEVCIVSSTCIFKDFNFNIFLDSEKPTEALVINPLALSALVKENVYLENFVLKNISDKFSKVLWTMEQIIFTKFDKRLALFLLEESKAINSNKIKITHEQIAKYLGTAREVVSRMLKYFEQEKIISLSRGSINIKDIDKLKTYI